MLGYEFAKKTMELFEKILSSVERNEGLKIFIRMANKENDIDICLEDFFVKKVIEKYKKFIEDYNNKDKRANTVKKK